MNSAENAWEKDYYMYDGRGSVSNLTSQYGYNMVSYKYDEFGNQRESGWSNFNSYGYNGESYDYITGLQYLRARYYDPATGRFLTQDTVQGDVMNPLTQNLYSYTQNNPLNLIDPSGHWSIKKAFKKVTKSVKKAASSAKKWVSDHKEQIKETIKIVAVAAVITLAVVATAGAATGAIGIGMGVTAMSTFGVSAATAATIGAIASTATYVAAGALITSTILTSASDAGEVWTGKNYGKKLVGEKTYNNVKAGTSIASMLFTQFGAQNSQFKQSKAAKVEQQNAIKQKRCENSSIMQKQTVDPKAKVPVNAEGGSQGKTLYHYTNEKGMNGIVDSKQLNSSLKESNFKDARYGNGQYLSDITPDSKSPAQLSKEFINVPNKYKYTNCVEINVDGLNVVKGRDNVFVVPNESPLDLSNRIVNWGQVNKK